MLKTLSISLTCIILCVSLFFVKRPEKPTGVEQEMIIKSKVQSQPVLLNLHGGMPDYFLTKDSIPQMQLFFLEDALKGTNNLADPYYKHL
jgi:hypothetical protein